MLCSTCRHQQLGCDVLPNYLHVCECVCVWGGRVSLQCLWQLLCHETVVWKKSIMAPKPFGPGRRELLPANVASIPQCTCSSGVDQRRCATVSSFHSKSLLLKLLLL
jgi:hypothetical protein